MDMDYEELSEHRQGLIRLMRSSEGFGKALDAWRGHLETTFTPDSSLAYKLPMQAVEIVPPNPPSESLVDMERELAGLVVEYGILKKAYHNETQADDLANIARAMSRTRERIAELQQAIVETEAETPAGAAVQLRRLQRMLEHMRPSPCSPFPGMETPRRLLASALAAVET